MGRPKKYPPSLLIACDLALRFADALADDPKLAMSHFRETHAPWLDNRKFAEYIALLEERYGVPVFDVPQKKTGHYRVTEAGRRLLDDVRRFLDRLGGSPQHVASRYTVASFVFSTAYILAPALGAYYERREHRQVGLKFQEFRDLGLMLDRVSERRVGCAFLAETDRLSMEAYSNELEFRPLARSGVRPVLVYPATWKVRPDSPEDLAERLLVVPDRFPREWARLIPRVQADALAGRLVVTSFVEALALVRAKAGYTIMPGVYRNCLDTPDAKRELGILQLPEAHPTPFGVIVPRRFDETAPAELRELVSIISGELNAPGYLTPQPRA